MFGKNEMGGRRVRSIHKSIACLLAAAMVAGGIWQGTGVPGVKAAPDTTDLETVDHRLYATNDGEDVAGGAVKIYVAPVAVGDGSTADTPIGLTDALTKVEPGQEIHLAAGVYDCPKTIVIDKDNSGTEDAMKYLIADGEAVLDFSAQQLNSANRGMVLDGSYWHIYGVTFKGAGDNGMLLAGSHNIVELCVFTENRDTGLQVSRYRTNATTIDQWPSYNLIKNCTSFDNSDSSGENADGFAAKLTCGEGNVFDGCMSYNNSDDGWDLFAKSETGPIGVVTLRNCIAFRNGKLTSGDGSASGDMNGFKLGGSGIGTPHVVVNCIAFENGAHGFTDNNNPTAITLKNCTSVNNSVFSGSNKGNFTMSRESGGVNSNLLSYTDKRIATDAFMGTVDHSVYYNNTPRYYSVTESTAFNGKEKIGTEISLSASVFYSMDAPGTDTDFHTAWREQDGSINTHGFLEVLQADACATMAADGGSLGARLSNEQGSENPVPGMPGDPNNPDNPDIPDEPEKDIGDVSQVASKTYTENFTFGKFTVTATAEKTVKVEGNKQSYDGVTYTKCIKLGGQGTGEYRSILYTAEGPGTITVYAMSSNDKQDREFALYLEDGTLVQTLPLKAGSLQKLTFTVPKADSYYLASVSAGVNIYWIEACCKADGSQGGGQGGEQGGQPGQQPDMGDILPEDMPSDGVIPDGMWIAGVEDMPYTGKAVRQTFRVYDHATLLKEKTDYTVSYKNNINAAGANDVKAPAVIIRGKGNYGGSETVYFNILPADISGDGTVADDLAAKYNKKFQYPVPKVTVNNKKLINKKDYTVSYPDRSEDAYKKAGTYDIVITGVGNYTGERTINFTVSEGKTLMNSVKVSSIKAQTFTGEAIEPALTVKSGSKILVEGTDYETAYEDNTEIGTASVVLKGLGDYSGVKRVTFKITGQSIGKAIVNGLGSVTYNGAAHRPELGLTVNGNGTETTLQEGRDYTLDYQSNTGAGTAVVFITGINGYTGTVRKNFKIEAFDLKTDTENQFAVEQDISVEYAKGGAQPKPEVTFNGEKLVEGRDYTLSYKNNKALGDPGSAKAPIVTIVGRGNFKGSKTVKFTITRQSLANLKLAAADKVFQDKAGNYATKVSVLDIDGKKLTVKKDYEAAIVYSYHERTTVLNQSGQKRTEAVEAVRDAGENVQSGDILPVGTVVDVTIRAKENGNYFGELTDNFRITSADIARAKVKISQQIYTGEAISLAPDQMKVTMGSGRNLSTLNTGQEYEIVGYRNNVKKGTATVTIKGIGNYGGTKTVKFKIAAKGFQFLTVDIGTKIKGIFGF